MRCLSVASFLDKEEMMHSDVVEKTLLHAQPEIYLEVDLVK